jgi:hypothetical protein
MGIDGNGKANGLASSLKEGALRGSARARVSKSNELLAGAGQQASPSPAGRPPGPPPLPLWRSPLIASPCLGRSSGCGPASLVGVDPLAHSFVFVCSGLVLSFARSPVRSLASSHSRLARLVLA